MVAVVGQTPDLTLQSSLKSVPEKSRGAALFPLWPLPHRQHCSAARRFALHGRIPKALPPLRLIRNHWQQNRDKVKEQSGTSERELSEEDIANLSGGEFKALVMKMLTELIELG